LITATKLAFIFDTANIFAKEMALKKHNEKEVVGSS
jgi:hypothetical protein